MADGMVLSLGLMAMQPSGGAKQLVPPPGAKPMQNWPPGNTMSWGLMSKRVSG